MTTLRERDPELWYKLRLMTQDRSKFPVNVSQAAEYLGVSPRRVRALIESGRLEASQYEGRWYTSWPALEAASQRKPGRPAKP